MILRQSVFFSRVTGLTIASIRIQIHGESSFPSDHETRTSFPDAVSHVCLRTEWFTIPTHAPTPEIR